MKLLPLVALSLMLSACGTTSGPIGELPTVSDPKSAAKVVTARIVSLVGALNGYTVALNGKDLYGIGSGEYAEFSVPAGEHYIAVKCFGGWSPTWKEDSLKFVAKATETSYFVIAPNMACAEISASTAAEVKPLIAGSKAVSLDQSLPK